MSSTSRDTARALAYPEPPASLCWHRTGASRPLTPDQQRRNRELLTLALAPRTPRPRTLRTTSRSETR
ncbi:hypothetical protein [Streptomyces sp. NPDC093223]|uniref:hypothetical protein n=1 Tax=Streptomyces sp. NPDC093223 TaxID=3366033 RepID=UPI003810D446